MIQTDNNGAARRFRITGNTMRLLLGIMFVLVVADGLITSFLVHNDLARELNPFLRSIVDGPLFIPIKAVGALVSVLIMWHVYRRQPRVALTSSLGLIVAYTGLVYWNLLALLLATA
ncbi:MAG: hypothetical protein HYX87_02335 [Chloroflexi bacterium]|nr:hypothetical protein [Chloroflexota bacterium]